MTIVLIHIGKLPDYFWDCVEQIKRYHYGAVHAVVEREYAERCLAAGVTTVVPMDTLIDSNPVKAFEQTSFFHEYGEFWDYTARRLFVLEELISRYHLSDVIHIENDVLIYGTRLPRKYRKVAVNPVGPKYATYAYCYIPDLTAIHAMNTRFLEILSEGKEVLNARYGEGMVNEMLIAKQLLDEGVVDFLPTVPSGPGSDNFYGFHKAMYDGSAAGQYLGGIPSDPTPGRKEKNRYIGDQLISGDIDIIMKEPEGWIRYRYPVMRTKEGKEHLLLNLHIHSKRLRDFM